MSEIKISEERYLQLAKNEETYFKNFEQLVRLTVRKHYKESTWSLTRESAANLERIVNTEIRESGFNYPELGIQHHGDFYYRDVNNRRKEIYID